MKHILLVLLHLSPVLLFSQLQQIGHLPYDSESLAGCWHYVDSSGGEWALVGTSNGLSIVDLAEPTQPVKRFSVPGLQNGWRELKTWAGYAYVGSEAVGSGITIVDLRELPDTIYWKVWYGDGAYDSLIQRSHTVAATDGWLYVFGGSGNGAIIADLADPWNPHVVGAYTDHYVHDGYIRGDTLWASEIYEGQFTVIDVSDKSNPVPLVSVPTPGVFNHNSWLSDDSKILFTTDEKSNTPLGSFDVSDLNNVTLLDTYYPSQIPSGEVHNVRVLNDFLINPSYAGQLTLVDATRPDNLVETGWAGAGASLVWDADPYLPSGIIFATARTAGLFIYQPSYTHACWLEGEVTDALGGQPLNKAKVFILNTLNADTTRPTGLYKTGNGLAGTFSVLVEKEGYQSLTVPGVVLQNGQVTNLNVALFPEATGTQASADEDQFEVFPTLFKDVLTVQSDPNSPFAAPGVLIELFDRAGRLVLQTPATGTQTVLRPGPGLPAGTYILRLNSGSRQSRPVQVIRQ